MCFLGLLEDVTMSPETPAWSLLQHWCFGVWLVGFWFLFLRLTHSLEIIPAKGQLEYFKRYLQAYSTRHQHIMASSCIVHNYYGEDSSLPTSAFLSLQLPFHFSRFWHLLPENNDLQVSKLPFSREASGIQGAAVQPHSIPQEKTPPQTCRDQQFPRMVDATLYIFLT